MVGMIEARSMPLPRISAKVEDIAARLRQGLPISQDEKASILLSLAETAYLLSIKKKAPVSEHYVRQLKYLGKLPAEVEGPRFRLETVLSYTFHRPGPKPK